MRTIIETLHYSVRRVKFRRKRIVWKSFHQEGFFKAPNVVSSPDDKHGLLSNGSSLGPFAYHTDKLQPTRRCISQAAGF